MSKISIVCPECGANLRVKEDQLGKTAKCPSCGHRIKILPEPRPDQKPQISDEASPESVSGTEPEGEPPEAGPGRGRDAEPPPSARKALFPGTFPVSQQAVHCPVCGAKVEPGDKFCPNCGQLTTSARKQSLGSFVRTLLIAAIVMLAGAMGVTLAILFGPVIIHVAARVLHLSTLTLSFIIAGIILILLILVAARVLKKEHVLDRWDVLIEKGQGNAEEVSQYCERFIFESKAPSLTMRRRDMTPGFIRGLFGVRREFLEVTDRQSFRLKPFQIFINVRDYGNNLHVSWHLTYRGGLLSRMPDSLSDLDFFDEMDLVAYATVVHHSLLKAVQKLMVRLNQDPEKIDRKSKGFLGIS